MNFRAQGIIAPLRKASIAQGTIEYLVIIAVIITIALLVSILLLTQNDNALLIDDGLNEYPVSGRGGIIVVDSIVSSTGDAVVSLKNDTGEDLTITGINATDGTNFGEFSTSCAGELRVGHEKDCLVLDVNTLCPCVGNQTVTCNYKISYILNGIEESKTFSVTNTCSTVAPTYTLNYTAGGGGTISGTTIQKIILGGNGTPVTAIADEGYEFIDWNDGVTTQVRIDYGVSENINSKANFVLIERGTIEYPWIINDCNELQDMNKHLDGNYILGNNIDCSNTTTWDGGLGFKPIGTCVTPQICYEPGYPYTFSGNFDGNGHIISNLYINRPSSDYVGLFGHTLDSNISNVGLNNINVTGRYHVGGLVGRTWSSRINNSFVSGNVNGVHTTGGLIGWNSWGAIIANSYSVGTVIVSNQGVGGLVGSNLGAIVNSFSRSVVIGATAGGLVYSNNGDINNSFSTAYIESSRKGGLLYINDYLVNNSYWDMYRSETTTSAAGIGKNDEGSEMNVFFPKTELGGDYNVPMQNNENPENDWDFVNTWKKVDDWYPKLIWEEE